MARRHEKTQIKGTPVQELKRGRSCIKRSCSTGCGCLAFFGVGGMIFMALTARTRIVHLKKLPETLKVEVPFYDIENVTKRQTLKRPAQGSIARRIQEQFPSMETFFNRGAPTDLHASTNRYILEWTDVLAKPDFVASYYHDRLLDAGYTIKDRWNDTNDTITFVEKTGNTRGWIRIIKLEEGHTKITATIDLEQ